MLVVLPGSMMVVGCCDGSDIRAEDASELGLSHGSNHIALLKSAGGGPSIVTITEDYYDTCSIVSKRVDSDAYSISAAYEQAVPFECTATVIGSTPGLLPHSIRGVFVIRASAVQNYYEYGPFQDVQREYNLAATSTVDITVPSICDPEVEEPAGSYSVHTQGSLTDGDFTAPVIGAYYTIYWVPRCVSPAPALLVSFLSGGPWKVSVSSSTLTLIDLSTNSSYSYLGSISAVRTAMNAEAGGALFSVEYGPEVQTAGQSEIKVGDLKQSSGIVVFESCTSYPINLLVTGDDLSPLLNVRVSYNASSALKGVPMAGDDGTHELLFTVATPFPGNRAGALAWLRQRWYPKWVVGSSPFSVWTSTTTFPASFGSSWVWSTLVGDSLYRQTLSGQGDDYTDLEVNDLGCWPNGDPPPAGTQLLSQVCFNEGCSEFLPCPVGKFRLGRYVYTVVTPPPWSFNGVSTLSGASWLIA